MKAAAVAALLIAAAIAAPVLLHPTTRLFGAELVDRQHDPFTMMRQYADGRITPPYVQPATDVPGIAFAKAFGASAGYNVLLLITFPLAAAFAYAHARHFVAPAPALAASLLFAFSPFHLAHAAYHVHIAQIQWLPLFFLALWRLVEAPTPARAVALAASFLLVIASSAYLGFLSAVVAPFAAVAYGAADRRRALVWVGASLASAVGLVALSAAVVSPALIVNRGAFSFPLFALDQHSARWWSYLAPPLGHPWLRTGAALLRSGGIEQGRLEQQVSLGGSVIALAAIGLLGRTRVGGRFAASAAALAATALAAFVCSLPPTLGAGRVAVPMPSRLLYEIAPMFRSYARFGVVVSLMTTTLAGGGVAVLAARGTRVARATAVLLLAVAVFEYMPPRPAWRDVLPTSGHRWLARTRGLEGARLLDCTRPTPGETAGVGWLMQREVVVSAGPLVDCAESQIGEKAAAFGLTHIVVRADAPAGAWAVAGGVPDGTRPVMVQRDSAVYEVAAAPPRLYVSELDGFYPREYLAREAWRWMGARGVLTILNSTNAVLRASIEIEIDAFAGERRVDVAFDGAPAGSFVAAPARQWHRVGPFVVPPGAHRIVCTAPPTVGPGDDRALSVRLWRWRWVLESTP